MVSLFWAASGPLFLCGIAHALWQNTTATLKGGWDTI